MKKLFIAAFALVAGTLAAQAQSIHPRVEVAGNFARMQVKGPDGSTAEGLKVRPGFRASVDLLVWIHQQRPQKHFLRTTQQLLFQLFQHCSPILRP